MSDNHLFLPELAATSSTVERIAATLALENPNTGEQLAEIIHRTGLYALYADVFVPETSEPGSVSAFTAHINAWVTDCQTLEGTLRSAPAEQDADEAVQLDTIDLLNRWFVEACQFAGMSNTNPATEDEQQLLFIEFHEQESMRTLAELVGEAQAKLLWEAAEESTTEQFMHCLDLLRQILDRPEALEPSEIITLAEVTLLLSVLRD